MKSEIGNDDCQSVLCQVSDYFAVDDRYTKIQKGNECEETIVRRLNREVDPIKVSCKGVKVL